MKLTQFKSASSEEGVYLRNQNLNTTLENTRECLSTRKGGLDIAEIKVLLFIAALLQNTHTI